MNEIPLHKIVEVTDGKIAFSRHTSDNKNRADNDYVHRDDYYIFISVENGDANVSIDFAEYKITGNEILCILPGQVHSRIDLAAPTLEGSILAVDGVLVHNEYKEIFQQLYLKRNKIVLNQDDAVDLKYIFSIINNRLNSKTQLTRISVLYDLISAYIGFFAEMYQKNQTVSINNQPAIITSRFNLLLSENYKSLKRPSHYAEKLNISSAYLNECVKKITGITVSRFIQNEITLQAKRLLAYTNLNIKEIALQLGYEDWAYFTRLFTKNAKLSPTKFRNEYRKHDD